MLSYEKHYKILFLIPLVLIILSAGVVWNTTVQTGSFVQKGVSLSGGVSATATIEESATQQDIQDVLRREFPESDIAVRSLGGVGSAQTFVVDAADLSDDEQQAAQVLEEGLRKHYTVTSLSLETTGPALGEAFFNQTIIGILLAFWWMGWVVYLYFGDRRSLKFLMGVLAFALTMMAVKGVLSGPTGILILALSVLASMILYLLVSVPSGAVILAAASTILFTLAVINLLGVRLSTAGVAAFLMLIGYSVDTDILLSTRAIKNVEGSINERIYRAFRTGITMQVTTTIAVLAAFLLSSSEVIRQIMLIILIGMVGDIIFTWLQNAGVVAWYLQRQEAKA